MDRFIKIVCYSLSIISMLICGLIFLSNAWSFWSTIKEKSGLNGNIYAYYRVSRIQYELYNFIIATVSLFIAFQILFFTVKFNKEKLVKSLIHFLLFIFLFILSQIYLSARFVGKG